MLSAIDHVNLVVTDLPRMLAFYRDVLGLVVTKHVTIGGDWIGKTVGLRDVRAEVVYLDLPAGPRVELLRYLSPEAVRVPGVERPNAVGLRHLAFRVDDIDGAVARLRGAGVDFFSEVQLVPDSQVTYAGGVRKRLIYFRDPEGNVLELCEYAVAQSPNDKTGMTSPG
jgi:catechol 2,3-dioxygenase-like lactoylglutathione lyase family enzyme